MDLFLAHDGLSYGKKQFYYGINILKLGFHCVDYGLKKISLWTYVFPMMACPMGMVIQLWDK